MAEWKNLDVSFLAKSDNLPYHVLLFVPVQQPFVYDIFRTFFA